MLLAPDKLTKVRIRYTGNVAASRRRLPRLHLADDAKEGSLLRVQELVHLGRYDRFCLRINVATDPMPAETFSRYQRGRTTTEGVKNKIARGRGHLDDSLHRARAVSALTSPVSSFLHAETLLR